MERNYLLVYHITSIDKIEYEYFSSLDDMEKAIDIFKTNKNIKILHKYKVEEV